MIYGYNIRGCKAESEEDFRNDCSGRAVEAVGASYPFWKDGKVWYRAAYANPCPEKEILEIIPAENIPMFSEKVL